MPNAPTKTKLHDKLEDIILNTRRILEQNVQVGNITSFRAEKIRSDIQKQIDAALNVLDQQVVEAIYLQIPVQPSRDIANELAAENAALAALEN